jgi:hypothetical protein
MMTAESLSALVGVVLSLVFSYVPGVKDWFEGLQSGSKQALMGLFLIGASVAVYALACAGVYEGVVCDQAGAIEFFKVLVAALMANQSVYLITKR